MARPKPHIFDIDGNEVRRVDISAIGKIFRRAGMSSLKNASVTVYFTIYLRGGQIFEIFRAEVLEESLADLTPEREQAAADEMVGGLKVIRDTAIKEWKS